MLDNVTYETFLQIEFYDWTKQQVDNWIVFES